MGNTRKGGLLDSKKAAGQARKAETAAKKAAAADAQREAEEAEKWEKGAKSNAKKESEAQKKAEAAKKKAEREALLAEEEKNTPGRSNPKNTKTAVKKSKGLDLSQLDDDHSGSKGLPSLSATGIDNALDALSLAGPSDTKIDRHPERRVKAALAAFEERRLKEMEADGSGAGLRMNQRKERIRKEFEKSPENPMNQLSARYDATKEELAQLKAQERDRIDAALKQASPPGVFVSLTPGDPSLWSGVIFVRRGPYATAILRFQISFPDAYPALPPLVTFSTDMFHPLITPLTTYMYTTDVQEGGTVSATDEERLPPGGFSLRCGFPGWFGRGRRREAVRDREEETTTSPPPPLPPRRVEGENRDETPPPPLPPRSLNHSEGHVVAVGGATPGSVASESTAVTSRAGGRARREASTYEVLEYIRSTFDDADVLDSVPLEAAGNPGAWHAWRTHRRALERRGGVWSPSQSVDGSRRGSVVTVATPTTSAERLVMSRSATPSARRPEEWNWEGVWHERVKRGVATSLSEAVLFGGAGMADEVINFLNMDEAEVDETKQNLLRTLGAVV
ncbi:hypothetical protein QBC42DRAFT_337380 [Cladorrhinum samala]|uniref:UBC core domain-containing protein n=1 Tax=Cladorrhinum samala TaxID=585594 RepID=A0AAV9HSI7_9PEZI|nr:hypothetical protein QBC42DRAFT_337380 [Cladorrhinum samala]